MFKSRNNETVFHFAAKSKNRRSFEYVLKFLKNAKIVQEEVKKLIATRDSNSNTAITLAANRGMYSSVRVFIDMGADFNNLTKIQLNKLKGLLHNDNNDTLLRNIECHLSKLLKNEQKNQMQEEVEECYFSISNLYA
ncbi:hypothetical protein QE152_g5541 [Popillia japonica]|uniref:Ankyrin repeat protein n=1 Tax=Popillia japonica TaxID=7064 RepID=A0AAW1MLL6_POPJA